MLSRTSICKRIILSDRKVVHNNKLKNCKKKNVRNDDLQKMKKTSHNDNVPASRAVICKICTNNIFPKKTLSINPEFALFTGAVKFCKCYQTLKSKPAIILVQDDDDDDIE